MSEADPSGRAPAAADVSFVERDLPCLGCGYNLRGLGLAGLCPECATPLARSRAGNLLRNCQPDWVGRVALGLRLIAAAFTLCLTPLVIGLLIVPAAMVTSSLELSDNPILTAFAITTALLASACALLAPLLALVGIILVTWPDPSRTDPPRVNQARAAIRWSAGAVAVFVALQQLHRYLPLGGMRNIVAAILMCLVLLAAALAIGLLLRYCANLCVRLPDLELRQKFLKSGQSFTSTVVVLAAVAALRAVLPWTAAATVLSLIAALLWLILLLSLARVWGLNSKLAREVRAQHDLARATWPGAAQTVTPDANAEI